MTAIHPLKLIAISAALFALNLPTISALPPELPDPDGSAVNTNKPVKVFVLAGQSNMVGMGLIAGSEPGTLETLTTSTVNSRTSSMRKPTGPSAAMFTITKPALASTAGR